MRDLEQLDRDRRLIEDFTSRTLDSIPGDISRLLHVATLRDLATGRYRHDGLASIYSEAAVDQALRLCHEELFERILEASLEAQEIEIRKCLAGFDGNASEIAARWEEHEFYKFLVPSGLPVYLRELFCSNLRTLLQIIADEDTNHQSDA
ncbi:MAG TPA: hypothetical protein VKB26_03585 [Candidatus Acidoferrales bacterium]|nr:hypothetical protein [Candidatus Acidoferrales bacterium]